MGEYRLEISDDETNPLTTKIINQSKLFRKEHGISLEDAVELLCEAMKIDNKYLNEGDS